MYGLVLEGGGAKGSYHVGAYKALLDLDIKVNGVAGTSIGALNGAAIVQGDLSNLEKLWEEISVDTLFGINKTEVDKIKDLSISKMNIPFLFNLSKEIITNKGLDTTKMREIIEDFIDEDKIRKSKLDFGFVTISLTDKQPLELFKEDVPKGKLVDYLLASANLPAFKMEKMDGKLFLDGGYYDNLPINILCKKGYKNFIAVRTFALGRIKKVNKDEINVVYIQPVEDLGGTIDFDVKRAERNMKLGYYDTIKVFKELKGYKYYIKPYKKNFLRYILEIFDGNEDKIVRIGRLLGFVEFPTDRLIFEKILPRLQAILELKETSDYQDIILRIVEYMAEKYTEIEQFKIYDADDFIKLVVNQFRKSPIRVKKKIPSFMSHNKLLSLAVKDDLIITIFREIFFD